MKVTSGPAIGKPGEMAAILSNLQEGDVLFVDEIHRLNRQVEEVLYPAMEDYAIDIMLGKGAAARCHPSGSAEVYPGGSDHARGTFVGTVKRPFWRGASSGVLHGGGGLKTIILHSALTLGVEIDEEGACRMARRSRGTPRLGEPAVKARARFRAGKIRRPDFKGGSVLCTGSAGG